MIRKNTFENLKVGDKVLCEYGSKAEVVEVGVRDAFNRKRMVKLKVEVKKWSCPYFFRKEIKRKLA